MLVDLGRNDLGRVCEYGTVHVPELLAIERYSHVMHIVSHVTGQLREGLDAFDLLRATFPAGTVSGAPKVRAMEIIEELEGVRRGPYAGAVGYFGFNGNMDTCITIRTIVMQRRRGLPAGRRGHRGRQRSDPRVGRDAAQSPRAERGHRDGRGGDLSADRRSDAIGDGRI